jgi:hypothetical protein
MLHILNGDATAPVFAGAGLPGDVLVWRDILVEGPATAEWTSPAALAVRTAFLAERLGIDSERYRNGVREQEAGLAMSVRHDEVVLWFEQDLFCAVNLWYVLAWFAGQPAPTHLSLVYPSTEEFRGLGVLTSAQLAALFGERRPVTTSMLALGHRAWKAYTDASPREAAALAELENEALPFVRDACRCHGERFPSVATGLNEIETAILEVLGPGAQGFGELFRLVSADPRARRHGMGDVQIAAYVRGLAPLVAVSASDVMTADVSGTPLGRDVLAGRRDWPSVKPIDVWLGGVHLEGSRPSWRWDGARRRLVQSPG